MADNRSEVERGVERQTAAGGEVSEAEINTWPEATQARDEERNRRAKICAFIDEDGRIFSSESSAAPTNKITAHIYQDKTPRDLMETNWAEDHAPWQPWVIRPQYIIWNGLFSRLDVTRSNIPIIYAEGRVMLDPELRERWQTLEQGILQYMRLLSRKGLYHLDTVTPRCPSDYGYWRSFTSTRKLKTA
ncbi:hypothetical protein OE88DRAFT_1733386, partial [Heliocybe sulcata]